MQLKKINIRNKLAIATSALLLGTSIQAADSITSLGSDLVPPIKIKENDFNTSALYYSEEDRVTVKKSQSKISKQLNDANIIRTELTYDTMSGASPNGRIVTDDQNPGSVTITTASGFQFDANNTSGAASKSWLTQFKDTRKAINLEWEYKATPTFTTILGAGTSSENDYESYSSSGNIILDFNQKRSSLNLGVAISNDTIKAIGGIPEGLGVRNCNDVAIFQPAWLNCDAKSQLFKPAEKIVTDYIIGLSQVWNRRTILKFNYGLGRENGYLTDPYKQISATHPEYTETAVLYEKRPSFRNTNSVFFKIVHIPFDNVALNTSYRYFWDNWNVSAHTVDSRLRLNIGSRVYLQAHGRLHNQSAAFFFDKEISVSDKSPSYYATKPDFISADSRLSKLVTATAGVKIGVKFSEDVNISARVEQIQQHYYSGVLPRMKVWIAQFIINFKF